MTKIKQRGMVFFIVIGIGIILLILVSSLLYYMMSERKLISNYIDSTRALYIAEAGIEQAIFEIQADLYKVKNYGWNKLFDSSDTGADIPIKTFSEIASKIKKEIPGGRLVDVRVSYELFPFITEKYGQLKIKAEGEYRGINKIVEVVKNFYGFDAHDGGFSPGLWRTLFILKEQNFPHYGISTDFKVHGERVYMRKSIIDLGDTLVDKLCRFIDMGFGFFGGGVDLTDVDVLEGRIFKRYLKFTWKKAFNLIPYPAWVPTVEEYNDRVMPGVIFDKVPNLKNKEEYKKVATKVFGKKDKKDVRWQGYKILGHEFAGSVYKNVVPFYGWGDWKNVPVKWWEFWKNPTKADDASHPIELNGIYFVDGDVYIEGYYKGNGAIVATGNIYIAGDLLKWGGSPEIRKKSGLSLIALNGEVIWKPHYDKDWSRYPAIFNNLNPYIEASIYAKKGFRMIYNSPLKELVNLTIKGNLVVEKLNRKEMPHDVTLIEDKDLEALQKPWPEDYGITHKYFLKETILSWKEYR